LEPDQYQQAIDMQRRGLDRCAKLAADVPDEPAYRETLAYCYVRLGGFLRRASRHQEAIDALREALKVRPDDPAAQNQLAWILVTHPDPGMQDYQQAIRLAQRAVEVTPQGAGYRNTLGVAYYRQGDYRAAVNQLEAAMRLRAGGISDDWFFLAMALWQLGDRDNAFKWFDRAMQWMEKNRPGDTELRRFSAEAEALLRGATPPAQSGRRSRLDTHQHRPESAFAGLPVQAPFLQDPPTDDLPLAVLA
jgi:tetratricopeptide (TPR) repeat protein